jgi:multidrug efflux pump subunit AcrA (membrane-fusion protein)
LEATLAEAESQLARIKTEQSNLPYAIRAAEAKEQAANEQLASVNDQAEAFAKVVVQRAVHDVDGAKAALDELRSRGPHLDAEAAALQRKCEALRRQLELKTDETRRAAETAAGVQSAQARLRQAELAVDAAKLRLERLTLHAPIAGRVLAVHAQPGRRVTGLAPASEQDSSAVVSLYDPAKLQVRADVRLEDVPQVQSGQTVQISCAVLPQPLTGKVLLSTSVADIQKNTLQVKIAIDDPPPVIKPEMIVQATFLSAVTPQSKSTTAEQPLRLLVPRQLIDARDGSPTVWLADQRTGTARRQAVSLGKTGGAALVEVVEGLNPTDKLIVAGRESISPGDRIRITAEDASLGTEETQSSAGLHTETASARATISK